MPRKSHSTSDDKPTEGKSCALEHMHPGKHVLKQSITHGNLETTIGELTEAQLRVALYIRERQIIKLMTALEKIWNTTERAYMSV